MKKIKKKTNDFNNIIFALAIILGVIGLFVILTASSYLTIKNNVGRFSFVLRHGVFLLLGIGVMILVSRVDYKLYYRYAGLIYIVAIFLMILTKVPFIKVQYNYSDRAIGFGPFSFMPSDLMKLAGIIFMAKWLILNKKNQSNFLKGVVHTGIFILIPFVITFAQPDLSTGLVIFFTLSSMYLVGGFNKKFLLPISLIAIILLLLGSQFAKEYQFNRILAWLDPEKYYQNESWQVLNGLFAVSRGGVLGAGFGKSIFKYGYLSNEVINDMIFAVIAEEFGFIKTAIFLGIYFFFIFYIIRESLRRKDLFEKYLLFGAGSLIFIQSFINMGVSISLIPNTGINLPFISYGGTSLITFYALVGIVLNITRHRVTD